MVLLIQKRSFRRLISIVEKERLCYLSDQYLLKMNLIVKFPIFPNIPFIEQRDWPMINMRAKEAEKAA